MGLKLRSTSTTNASVITSSSSAPSSGAVQPLPTFSNTTLPALKPSHLLKTPRTFQKIHGKISKLTTHLLLQGMAQLISPRIHSLLSDVVYVSLFHYVRQN